MANYKIVLVDTDVISHFIATGNISRLAKIFEPNILFVLDMVYEEACRHPWDNERKEKVNFSKSYYSSSVGLMVNITKIGENTLKEERIRSIIDLDNKIIGVMSNSTTRRDFLDYIQKHNINISPRFVTYKSYEQLAKALDNGDIDVFCVDVTILTGYLDENKKILDDRFATQHYGIASPKDKEGLNEIANIVVSEMD